MAPWTFLLRTIEDALYAGVHALSSIVGTLDDLSPGTDPLLGSDPDSPLVA
jgi:hypothetical protein